MVRFGAWTVGLVLAWALAGVGWAQAGPQLVFTTDYADAAIYIDGSLACRQQCAIQDGVPGTQYTVTCKLQGYHDGVAAGVFPAEGTVVVKCPLNAMLDDVAVGATAAGGEAPPGPAEVLTPSMINAVVVSHEGLQGCFADAEGRGETHAGKLRVRFWVTPDGSAGNAAFETEGYEGTVIQDCVLQELGRLRFPPYTGSEGKRIKVPLIPGRLKIAARDAAVSTTQVAAAGAAGDSPVTPGLVDAVIGSDEVIAACLEEAREKGRWSGQAVWLQFAVAPGGDVRDASFEEGHRAGSTTEQCVTERVDQLWFPSSTMPADQLVMIRLGGE